jgi:hypothetical protein
VGKSPPFLAAKVDPYVSDVGNNPCPSGPVPETRQFPDGQNESKMD